MLALDQRREALAPVRVRPRPSRRLVRLAPCFDLELAWNPGISFGWFQNDGALAQIILMVIKAVAVIVLAVWMARSQTLLATLALGLIIGGAIGNGIDRFAYGAVVDFALFHVQIGEETYKWYVRLTLPMWRLLPGWRPCCMTLPGNTCRKSALIPGQYEPHGANGSGAAPSIGDPRKIWTGKAPMRDTEAVPA